MISFSYRCACRSAFGASLALIRATGTTARRFSTADAIRVTNAIARIKKHRGLSHKAAVEFALRSFIEIPSVLAVVDNETNQPAAMKMSPDDKVLSMFAFTSPEKHASAVRQNTRHPLISVGMSRVVHMSGREFFRLASSRESDSRAPAAGIIVDLEIGFSFSADEMKFSRQYLKEGDALRQIVRHRATSSGVDLAAKSKEERRRIINATFDEFMNRGPDVELLGLGGGRDGRYLTVFSTPLTFLNYNMDKPPPLKKDVKEAMGMAESVTFDAPALPADEDFITLSAVADKVRSSQHESATVYRGFIFNPPHDLQQNMSPAYPHIYTAEEVWF